MTGSLTIDSRRILLGAIIITTVAFALLIAPGAARAAKIIDEDRPADAPPQAVEDEARSEKVVVAPEPPHWSGWDGWNDRHPSFHRSAPRVQLWVDRGEWATYRPGDRLWVYFRVDRPCYITILDYSPDGRVEAIYPSRWSGSSYVHPGRTYRIPESRRYSLRIAGSGGVETLVACAHETPWPSGPAGVWIPGHRPNRGRVVVGRPGGSPPPGWRGRVIVGPNHWPVPPQWYDRPERWSCDSVSFYVEASWYDGGRRDDWYGDDWDGDWYDDDWRDDDWYERDRRDNDWRDWNDGRGARVLMHDDFRINDADDRFTCGVDLGRRDAMIEVKVVESSKGDPTEIVGRLSIEDRWGDETLFRIDVQGEHGDRPVPGRVYRRQYGNVLVEVEVKDFKLERTRSWQIPRFKWIKFDVRVLGR